jgi:hypothetical protein
MAPKGETPPDIPDLEIPASRPKPSAPVAAAPPAPPQEDFGDFGDMEIERGGHVMVPPSSSAAPRVPPSASMKAASGLELAAPRSVPRPRADLPPSTRDRLVARAITSATFAGAAFGLFETVAWRSSVSSLWPHAFDATSSIQSGAVAITAIVIGTAIGAIGLKLRPRSTALIGSAAAWLITSLAMITVALVATEEHAAPADGALLVPYTAPLAILLVGLGLAARAPALWLRRGSHRALALVAGAGGGLLAFVGYAILGSR